MRARVQSAGRHEHGSSLPVNSSSERTTMTVRRSCCGFVCVLIFELLAWALAVIAVATSFWICECALQL